MRKGEREGGRKEGRGGRERGRGREVKGREVKKKGGKKEGGEKTRERNEWSGILQEAQDEKCFRGFNNSKKLRVFCQFTNNIIRM